MIGRLLCWLGFHSMKWIRADAATNLTWTEKRVVGWWECRRCPYRQPIVTPR